MNDILRVLRAASWRVAIANFLYGLVLTLIVALLVLMVMRVVEQTTNLIVLWKQVAYGAAGVCMLGGIVWAIVAKPNRLAVARRVDEGAALKESLSTALCVADRQQEDPWARATVETASRVARGLPVARAVPIEAPKLWPVPIALGLALAVLFLTMPKLNWFTVKAPALAQAPANQAEVVQAKAETKEAEKKIEELTKKLNLDAKKPEAEEAKKPEPQNPEDIRKAAIKELTKTNDRLEELRAGVKAQKLEAMQQQLKSIKSEGEQTSDLAKAMAAGNFSQAKQELEKLKQQAMNAGQNGGMSEAQKKDVAKQLDNLAKQMDKMAKNQQDLNKQLQAAGIDPKAANSPSGLQKAIAEAQNLSESQKQQLQQAAQAMQQAQQSMEGMSQSMQKMAEGMQGGNQESVQEGAQAAQGQLSELEQMSQDMAMAAAAQSEVQSQINKLGSKCEGGQCNGEGDGQGGNKSGDQWSKGWAQRQGKRQGEGHQSGGSSGAEQADFAKEDRKSIGPIGQGPIVGTRFVKGDSIKGESKAEFVATVAKADQAATEAIENNTIPREYHEAIKNYFGRLKDKGGAGAAGKPAEPAEPEKPGEPAEDAGKKK